MSRWWRRTTVCSNALFPLLPSHCSEIARPAAVRANTTLKAPELPHADQRKSLIRRWPSSAPHRSQGGRSRLRSAGESFGAGVGSRLRRIGPLGCCWSPVLRQRRETMVPPVALVPFSLWPTLAPSHWRRRAETSGFALATQSGTSPASLDDPVAAMDSLAAEDVLSPLFCQHGGTVLFRRMHASRLRTSLATCILSSWALRMRRRAASLVRVGFSRSSARQFRRPQRLSPRTEQHAEVDCSGHRPGFIFFFSLFAADEKATREATFAAGAVLHLTLQASLKIPFVQVQYAHEP